MHLFALAIVPIFALLFPGKVTALPLTGPASAVPNALLNNAHGGCPLGLLRCFGRRRDKSPTSVSVPLGRLPEASQSVAHLPKNVAPPLRLAATNPSAAASSLEEFLKSSQAYQSLLEFTQTALELTSVNLQTLIGDSHVAETAQSTPAKSGTTEKTETNRKLVQPPKPTAKEAMQVIKDTASGLNERFFENKISSAGSIDSLQDFENKKKQLVELARAIKVMVIGNSEAAGIIKMMDAVLLAIDRMNGAQNKQMMAVLLDSRKPERYNV